MQIKSKIAIFAGMRMPRPLKGLATWLLVLTVLAGPLAISRAEPFRPAKPRIPRPARLALADLDGDDLADKAELGGTGPIKNIQLRLSRTGQFSILTFNTASFERGSLLAQDVNDDGEVDLIWTDLVHPDDVVIWLNNGLGRFERADPGGYADRFTIGSFGINQPFGGNYETSIGFYRVSSCDSLVTETPRKGRRAAQSGHLWSSRASGFITLAGPPTDRAPPSV